MKRSRVSYVLGEGVSVWQGRGTAAKKGGEEVVEKRVSTSQRGVIETLADRLVNALDPTDSGIGAPLWAIPCHEDSCWITFTHPSDTCVKYGTSTSTT